MISRGIEALVWAINKFNSKKDSTAVSTPLLNNDISTIIIEQQQDEKKNETQAYILKKLPGLAESVLTEKKAADEKLPRLERIQILEQEINSEKTKKRAYLFNGIALVEIISLILLIDGLVENKSSVTAAGFFLGISSVIADLFAGFVACNEEHSYEGDGSDRDPLWGLNPEIKNELDQTCDDEKVESTQLVQRKKALTSIKTNLQNEVNIHLTSLNNLNEAANISFWFHKEFASSVGLISPHVELILQYADISREKPIQDGVSSLAEGDVPDSSQCSVSIR